MDGGRSIPWARLPRQRIHNLTRSASFLVLAAVGIGAALLGVGREAVAQEAPARLDVSLGYLFLWSQDGEPSALPLGFAAGLAFNPTSSLSVVADAGVSSDEGADAIKESALLGGLRYSRRRSGIAPYAEVLGGASRRSVIAEGTPSTPWDKALQVGAGAQVRVRPNTYVRASADFRTVFGPEGSTRRFRFYLGLTLGLRRPRGEPATASVPAGTGIPSVTALPSPAPEPVSSEAAPAPGVVPFPSPESAPVPATPAEPTRIPETPPSPTPAPAPPPDPALASAAPSGLPEAFVAGVELMRGGRYGEASAAFQESLRAHAAGSYTVAVGLFCEETNIAELVKGPGLSEPLLITASFHGGRTCYRVYWGLFVSQAEARRAFGSMPAALRAPHQTTLAVSRLLH